MRKVISILLVLALFMVVKVAKADFTFGEPVNLGSTVNSSAGDFTPCLSPDGLSLYFASGRSGGYGGQSDIWVAQRESIKEGWGLPINLGPIVNSSACEISPRISTDGLSLFFSDAVWGVAVPHRPGGYGDGDLWVATRTTKDDDWSEPMNLGPIINSTALEGMPEISADGLSLYFSSNRSGGMEI